MFGMIAASLFAASATGVALDTGIFDTVLLADDLIVTTYGIIEDTRCPNPELCFREERLVVATVIEYRGEEIGLVASMGEPIILEGGSLTLIGTTTRGSDDAINLEDYRLDWSFESIEND